MWKDLERNEAIRSIGYRTACSFAEATRSLHEWAKSEWAKISPPLLTCEAVITEACFLMREIYRGQESVLAMLQRRVIQISFHLDEETAALEQLLVCYRSVPMSLADACLVRMAEQYSGSAVLTLDSYFQIYRKDRNQVIPVIMPGFRKLAPDVQLKSALIPCRAKKSSNSRIESDR